MDYRYWLYNFDVPSGGYTIKPCTKAAALVALKALEGVLVGVGLQEPVARVTSDDTEEFRVYPTDPDYAWPYYRHATAEGALDEAEVVCLNRQYYAPPTAPPEVPA